MHLLWRKCGIVMAVSYNENSYSKYRRIGGENIVFQLKSYRLK
jgi:hypothetical protein